MAPLRPRGLARTLDGEQPLTEMRIVREAEWGGTYVSPLWLKAKVVFTPVGGGESLKVTREVFLGPAPGSYWTTTDKVGTDAWGEPVQVDTDGDGVPDSALPPPSNFVAGMGSVEPAAFTQRWCPGTCCHCTPVNANPPPEWDEDATGCAPAHLHCVPCLKPCIIVEPNEPQSL